MRMLDVKDLYVNYGAIKALKGVNFYVDEGEIVALIGSNGAGKTTTLRTISGLERARHGEILFKGQNICHTAPDKIVGLGVTHVPEGRRVFTNLTVMGNLKMAASLRKDKAGIKRDIDSVFDRFPRLKERMNQSALTLSGGEQQMLAISRAIMARPTLLLLDEPSLGLAPIIIQQIFSIIEKINADGTTVFLVEQNANQALRIANRAYVMENGRIVMEDSADKLLTDPAVQKAYLGM